MPETQADNDKTAAVLALLSEHSGLELDDSPEVRQQTLLELGISSVTFMVIIVELEDVLERPLDGADMFADVKTVADLLSAIGLS